MIEFLYTGNYNHRGERKRIFHGSIVSKLGFAMTVRISPDFDATATLGYTSRLVSTPALLADQKVGQVDAWQAQIRQEFPLKSNGETVVIERGDSSVWNWAISHELPDNSGVGGDRAQPNPSTVSSGWRDRYQLFNDPIAAGVYAYEGIWETNFFVYLRRPDEDSGRVRDYALSDPITHLVDNT